MLCCAKPQCLSTTPKPMCACLCMLQPEERCRFAKLARHTGNFGERACGKGELAQGLLESRYVAGLCETARLVETKRFVTSPCSRANSTCCGKRPNCEASMLQTEGPLQYAKTATELRTPRVTPLPVLLGSEASQDIKNCLGRLAACCNSSRAHERSCTKAHDLSWNLTCVLDHHRRASLALKLYILGCCLYRFIATGLPSRNPWCTVPNPPWPSFLVSRRLDTSILGSLALSFTPDVGCHSALFFLDLAPGCPKR